MGSAALNVMEDCVVSAAQLSALLVKPAGELKGAVVLGLLGTDSRFTSANHFLSSSFARAGLAVLAVELLTEDEDAHRELAHADLPLLAERLSAAADWLADRTRLAHERVALVGVGDVGAAALVAAAARPELARAVVCAATALDLAGTAVVLSRTPTLVLVGDGDPAALHGSRMLPAMHCDHRLEVICGAGPRLIEPGALDRVVSVATPWLLARLER